MIASMNKINICDSCVLLFYFQSFLDGAFCLIKEKNLLLMSLNAPFRLNKQIG